MSHFPIETHVDYALLASYLMDEDGVQGGEVLPNLIKILLAEMIDEKIREKFTEVLAEELEQMVIDHVNDELDSKVGDVVDEKMDEAVANIRCTLERAPLC